MLPRWRSIDYVPGAVVRERHLDHFDAVLAALRGGLRPVERRPITVHSSALVTGVSVDATGTWASFDSPGLALHLALPLRVGDRIVGWSLSLERAAAAGLTVELRRFAMGAPAYEVIHRQTSTPGRLALRAACPAAGLAAVSVAAGHVYRLVVTSASNNDRCYGGEVLVDHPRGA